MQFKKVLGLALAMAGFASVAYAGAPTVVTLNATAADTITVNMDTSDTLQGWSWGVCNDPAVPVLTAGDGSTTATVNLGNPPDFDTYNIFPDGWTVGVVISFLGMDQLDPGTGYELHVATYDNSGLGEMDTSAVTMCDATLGSPAVSNVVVVAGGSLTFTGATDATANVSGEPAVPDWGYDASDEVVSGAGATSTNVSFFVNDLSSDNNEDTQGFSMGWSHSGVASIGAITAVNDLAGTNGGAGPDFFGTSTFANGWTVGVVYAFLGGQFLQFPAGSSAVVETGYDYDIAADGSIDITVDNGLGSPPVANVVVVSGASFDAAANSDSGSIAYTLVVDTPFIRGDCNDDGIVNIADAVWTLNELFLAGPSSSCVAACDSNDDGMVDATDASYTLNYRFLDGPQPPMPFPGCGIVSGADCAASSCP